MNSSADVQLESWARYGHALGRAAANVVHEVNAPLGVALARAQLAVRLLDELPSEQAAGLDEQLRGCEAAIRAAATLVRDLNYLRDDLDGNNGVASATYILNAAYQLALLDTAHAGCELEVCIPDEDVLIASHPKHLLVLLLELIWERVARGATRVALELETCTAHEAGSVSLQVTSDVPDSCDAATQAWLDSLAELCSVSVCYLQVGRGVAVCSSEKGRDNEQSFSPRD